METLIKTCNKIVVTGGVGVGKTTLIDSLEKILHDNGYNVIRIKEFIEGHKDGYNMLDSYLKKSITAYNYQFFILKYFDDIILEEFTKKYTGNKDIMLFERVPDDTITCFVNNQYKNNLMSDEEYYKLYRYSVSINERYNLPSYFKRINNCLLLKSINKDIDPNIAYRYVKMNNFNNVVIGLYNTVDECYDRMCKRNRGKEASTYTKNSIAMFNKSYNKLYKMLMDGKCLRLNTIGSLIEDDI